MMKSGSERIKSSFVSGCAGLPLKHPGYRYSLLLLSIFCSAGNASVLEEILVTATKRSESTQTISVSVSAISGDELEARGITDFFDYATSIPNLSFGATSDGVLSGRSISIRGIEGINTTGVYIDDTPITETIDPRILDLERIEVLRGPTGTLYGARSLGGTIRQITKKADPDSFFGKVRAGVSSTDESDGLNSLVSGSLNIPLNENAALLVAGFYERQAGVFDRAIGTISDHFLAPATLDGPPSRVLEDVDDEKTQAFQASLFWQVNDNLTIEPKVMYQKTELDGFPLADSDPENFVQNRDFNTPEGGEDEWSLYSLNLNYKSEFGTFTSASSYFDRETFEQEGTGSFINFLQALPQEFGGFGVFDSIGQRPVPSPIFQELSFESFSQEFRFASDFGGSVEFVAGAFYQDIEEEENFLPRNFAIGFGDNLLAAAAVEGPGSLPDALSVFGDLVFAAQRPTDIEEFGIFGEISYQFSERFSAILGARYFDTEISFDNTQAGLAGGVPLANDAPLSSAPTFSGSMKDDGFNFKAALEYEYDDSLFFYGLVAEGFRIGGSNGPLPPTLGCPNIDFSDGYESDELISYEVGVKADVSESTRINAAIFYIDFDDIQQRVQLGCGFQFTENFGSARSQGVEVEFLSQPYENLTLGVNIGYTDAEFTETVDVLDTSGAIVFAVADGGPLQQVPELTASLSADFVAPAAIAGLDFFVRLDASYVDESESRVNSEPRVRDSYEQVNLRLGLRNEKYRATVFVRNLTDDIANLSDNRSLAAETPGRPRFVTSRPRTVGIEFGYTF